tara:strand:- start:144 stop:371 length:228 start_codon:yes stop_codon:yes gene_type:complete
MQASVVLEIWDMLQEFVPANKKAQAVEDLVSAFVDAGADEAWFEDILGEDESLDIAIAEALDIDQEHDPEEEWEG